MTRPAISRFPNSGPDPRQQDRNRRTAAFWWALGACLCLASSGLTPPARGQSAGTEAASSQGVAAPLSVIRWTASLPEAAGRTVGVRFALYQDQAGGLALWNETQTVKVGADGRYSVLLGATSAEGLPATLFQAGEARWIEARVAGAGGDGAVPASGTVPPARSLLAAVPYAFKSVDSETLAGRAAADYVTREDLQSAVAATAQPAAQVHPEVNPTGTGTTGYVPVWTGTSTLGNSVIRVSGANVGIGETGPVYPLDVNGMAVARGGFKAEPNGAATAAAGLNSSPIEFQASTYSSTTHAAIPEYFIWQVLPTGNNTASPGAVLALSATTGTTTKSTGFSFGPTGLLTFAPGQTFPGTIGGVTAGVGLKGGGTTGSVSLSIDPSVVPTLTASNTFTGATNAFTNPITFAAGQNFPGAITSVSAAAGSPLTASTTSGAVSVGLDYLSLLTELDNFYPLLSAANTFTNQALFKKWVTAEQGFTGYSTGEYATDSAVLAITGSDSYGSGMYQNLYEINAGVWGDNSGNTTLGTFVNAGVIGTADNNPAGYFLNNSGKYPSVTAYNAGSKGTGLFRTFLAASPTGSCGIGGNGDLTCTGQVKTLATTGGGARKVETYAMQSPENWMEDFGSGLLQHGVAVVKIDPSFAETVSATADYHVFLTPKGDSKGLYVINETATSFEVRESGGGTSSLSFDYRIVAKRRGYEAERLTDVTERFNAEIARATPPRATGGGHEPGLQAPPVKMPQTKDAARVAPGMQPAAHRLAAIQQVPPTHP